MAIGARPPRCSWPPKMRRLSCASPIIREREEEIRERKRWEEEEEIRERCVACGAGGAVFRDKGERERYTAVQRCSAPLLFNFFRPRHSRSNFVGASEGVTRPYKWYF